MKGDFTRYTYDRSKRYTGVLMQQGRVQVDADWNEQIQIQHDRERKTDVDLIGPTGALWSEDPGLRRDSFRVSKVGDDLMFAPGSAYVDGLQIVLDGSETVTAVSLADQPFLEGYSLPTEAGTYVVYLEAWERHVDAVEDDEIRDVALGGPDTATRKQLVWQVRLLKLAAAATTRTDVEADTNWRTLVAGPTGTLNVQTVPAETAEDPCEVPEESGYTGLENQLYRVEVRDGNFHISDGAFDAGTSPPTYLWCRENGSISVSWTDSEDVVETDGAYSRKLLVSSTGRDENLGFAIGQWVELIDLERELQGEPGVVVQISDVDPEESTITVTVDASDDTTTAWASFQTAPRVRRWNSPEGARAIDETDSSASATGWQRLTWTKDGTTHFENIEVKFDAPATATYRTGDFWVIPARSITGEIAWSGEQTPQGPSRHYMILAVTTLVVVSESSSTWSEPTDLRERFVPLNEQIHLFMEGGDGQSGLPTKWLRSPLRVGVSNGLWPVANATVVFNIEQPELSTPNLGELREVAKVGGAYDPDVPPTGSGSLTTVTVTTDSNGIAQVWWRLGDDNGAETFLHQRVSAKLLTAHVDYALDDELENLHLVAHFTANPSVARDVAWDGACVDLAEAGTVTEALQLLCENFALAYISGDGQSAESGLTVPVPLTVRVSNGAWSKEGVPVRFRTNVDESGGLLFALTDPPGSRADRGTLVSYDPPGSSPTTGTAVDEIIVTTDDAGYASVHLQLPSSLIATFQQVVCTMLDSTGLPTGAEIVFNGTVTTPTTTTTTTPTPVMLYTKGDGQEGVAGGILPLEIEARVTEGITPVSGAWVLFQIVYTATLGDIEMPIGATGALWSTTPFLTVGAVDSDGYSVGRRVQTNASGLVSCKWKLGSYGAREIQAVRATLLTGSEGATAVPTEISLIFSARLYNRPIPTYYIPITGGTPISETHRVQRGGEIDLDLFSGLFFASLLLTSPSDTTAPTVRPTVDVEVEVPEMVSTEGTVLSMHWVRLRGTVSFTTVAPTTSGTTSLRWDLAPLTGLVAYLEAAASTMMPLNGGTLMMRAVVHQSLLQASVVTGSYDIESRYWLRVHPPPPGGTTPPR